jgi:hypothetical protein
MSAESQTSLLSSALLLVELVLLVVTVSLLGLNRKEQKSRDRLMEHISSATDVVTRQEYFLTVLESLQHSERYVYGSVTGSPPSSGESDVIRQVTDAISHAVGRNVKVRYVLPLSLDRLSMGQRYSRAGAEVKFNSAVLVSDARFMVVDDREVVIGVPERKGENEPTRKGYRIPSESVALLFRKRFEELWDSPDAKGYMDYLSGVVTKARESSPGISAESIASNLKIGREDVVRVLSGPG